MQRVMVLMSVVKSPDVKNKTISHYIIAEASVRWYQLSVGTNHTNSVLFITFCVPVIYILRKIPKKIIRYLENCSSKQGICSCNVFLLL